MIAVPEYAHFGGRHHESANLKNLLAFAGVSLSEPLCFAISGGIGAGYSFCPSVVRHGTGSGITIIGRHKIYATGAGNYQDFCDRLGIPTRITETSAVKKAQQNLVAELEAGRPTVVWCGGALLPFLGKKPEQAGLVMHSFLVHAVDEENGLAYGSDVAGSRVSLTLDELAEARNSVCTHKNRTLTIDPPKAIAAGTLRSGLRSGLQACAKELLDGKMKTFSLPGLEIWAKMITNDKNKDGWGKVFPGGLLALALEDVHASIVTGGDGDLLRGLFADSLDEAAAVLGAKGFADLARTYRSLGKQWAHLADTALPSRVKEFKGLKDILARRQKLIEKGEKAQDAVADTTLILKQLEDATRKKPPLSKEDFAAILEDMRGQIEDLHRQETDAATRLAELA